MNAKVMGNNLMVVTTKNLKDLKEIARRRPEALTITKEIDGEMCEVFRVAVGNRGMMCPNGIVFAAETNTDPKVAMVTVDVGNKPANVDMQEYVADKFGHILLNLAQIEAGLDAALEDIAAEKVMLSELISVEL